MLSLACAALLLSPPPAEPEWTGGDYVASTVTSVITGAAFGFGGAATAAGIAQLSDADGFGALGLVFLGGAIGAAVGVWAGPHLYAKTFDRPEGDGLWSAVGLAGGILAASGLAALDLHESVTLGGFVVLPAVGATLGYGASVGAMSTPSAQVGGPAHLRTQTVTMPALVLSF